MSGMQPVGVFAMKVQPGEMVPGSMSEGPMFRLCMAAVDPDAAPEYPDDVDPSKPPRATLKMIRAPEGFGEDSDEDSDEDDESSDDDDEGVNGGPSDPSKSKKMKEAAVLKEMEDAMEEDDSDDGDDTVDIKSAISKLIKGKAKATDDDSESEDSDDGPQEIVICTLDPEKHYQQALDLVFSPDEQVLFMVTGTHAVYLTGNYVVPADGGPDEDDEDYDYDYGMGEDELELSDEDDEDDELDGLENPRIMEIDSEDEAPKLVKAKGKNKRAADDDDEAANLDDMMAKDLKADGEQKLSKKQQKKLKKNNGEAAPAEAKAEVTPPSKSDKKVQFAKNLEQGPTPSSDKKKDAQTGTLGVKEVQGVKIDDKKLGKGRPAKSGDQVAMRYIGKLDNGKVFDSNKKGKPFTTKLGAGEVIKGMDIGVTGMAAGAERRIIIPAHLAYGKKSPGPGIPANARLTFDIKLISIK
ncbi:peptidylprolyl isomerase fpr4 [Arachnomyces sp. PD_36]|nr:peptidylprolyl isomerase fpr4 [Arachnomyces sp. PD_36]